MIIYYKILNYCFQVGRLPEKFVGRISVAVVRGLTYLKDEIKILHRGTVCVELWYKTNLCFQMSSLPTCLLIVTAKSNCATLESLECSSIQWPIRLSELGATWR